MSLCGGDTGPLWRAAHPRRAAGSQAARVTVDCYPNAGPHCGQSILTVDLRAACVGTSCLRKPLPAPLSPTGRRVREGKEMFLGFFLESFMLKMLPMSYIRLLKCRFLGSFVGFCTEELCNMVLAALD